MKEKVVQLKGSVIMYLHVNLYSGDYLGILLRRGHSVDLFTSTFQVSGKMVAHVDHVIFAFFILINISFTLNKGVQKQKKHWNFAFLLMFFFFGVAEPSSSLQHLAEQEVLRSLEKKKGKTSCFLLLLSRCLFIQQLWGFWYEAVVALLMQKCQSWFRLAFLSAASAVNCGC